MIDHGKHNLLGVCIDAVDYDAAVDRIMDAAQNRTPLSATALAVHGVMTGALDNTQRHRLNALDLVLPDGQPVRWGLNILHKTGLMDRVYGPTLTLKLCERAAEAGVPVFFYGSSPDVLDALRENLTRRHANLLVAGTRPSMFRRTSLDEKIEIAHALRESGAGIVFVGLGCPRQETFVYEYRDEVGVPLVAVGAAFDFHAGRLAQAPPWMQRAGLEWLFRLVTEPGRLWRRYLLLNPAFLTLFALQWSGLRTFPTDNTAPPTEDMRYG